MITKTTFFSPVANEAPTFDEVEDYKTHLIKSLAKQTLTELGVSLASTLIVLPFLVGAPYTFLIYTGASLAVNLSIRLIFSVAMVELYKRNINCPALPIVAKLTTAAFHVLINPAHYLGRNLLHELGHTGFLFLLAPNSTVEVMIRYDSQGEGAMLNLVIGIPNSLSNFLGMRASGALFTAGGPLVDLTLDCSLVLIAKKIRKKHPVLAAYLIIAAIVRTIQHAKYAVTDYANGLVQQHDYIVLSAITNIPRIGFAIAIVALPILAWIATRNKTKNE